MMTFKGETVKTINSDENILITGFLDLVKDLFMLPIDNVSANTEKQFVDKTLTSGFAGATSQWLETEYDGVVRLILPNSRATHSG